MCSHVLDGENTYTTPRELARLTGGPDSLRWLQHDHEMDWCLCIVDLPATLSHARLKWTRVSETLNFLIDR